MKLMHPKRIHSESFFFPRIFRFFNFKLKIQQLTDPCISPNRGVSLDLGVSPFSLCLDYVTVNVPVFVEVFTTVTHYLFYSIFNRRTSERTKSIFNSTRFFLYCSYTLCTFPTGVLILC